MVLPPYVMVLPRSRLVDFTYSSFRFWWQPPLVAAFYLVLSKAILQPWAGGALVITAFVYRVVIMAGIFDITAMRVFDRWPKPWHVADAQRFGPAVRRPAWAWMLMAQSVLLYSVFTILLVGWANRWVLSRSVVSIFVATVIILIISGVVRFIVLIAKGAAEDRCSILLLRKFGEVPSWQSRSGLIPTLAALGMVTTPHDAGFQEGEPSNPAEAVLPTVEHPDKESMHEWQEEIPRRMMAADLVVIDVSYATPAIGWEIAKAYELVRTKTLLVVDAEQLGIQQWDLHEELRRQVHLVVAPEGGSGLRVLTSFAAPLVYSKGLMSIIFSARMIRLFRRPRPAQI